VQARVMDAERTRLENAGLRAVLPSARRMRLAVVRAYQTGEDPHAPIRMALERVRASIRDGMVAADLQARLRSQAVARVAMAKGKGLRLSAYDEAVKMLSDRLLVSPSDLASMTRQYDAAALAVTNDIGSVLERDVQAAVRDAVAQGLNTRDGADMIRRAFDSAGVTPDNPYLFETIYRTQLQTAYSAGRWQANADPAIQEILWGYEFAAVMDDRTTDICSELDGQRHPKDDPFWNRFTPPNHYGCRSQIIEVFVGDRLASPTGMPSVVPAEGFDFNPGLVFPGLRAA